MAEKSLGIITPGGAGPVRLTANEDDPEVTVWAHSYRIQHLSGNTGYGVVGSADFDEGTGAGVYGFLPAVAEAEPWPQYQSPAAEGRQNPYDMSKVYLDASEASDGFLVSIVQV